MAGKTRRSKKEIIAAKMAANEEKIKSFEQKIEEIREDNNKLKEELDAVRKAEDEAAQAAEMKEMMKLIKSKGLNLEDVKKLLENSES